MDSRVKSDTCEFSTLTYYDHKTFYKIDLIKYSLICPAHIKKKGNCTLSLSCFEAVKVDLSIRETASRTREFRNTVLKRTCS